MPWLRVETMFGPMILEGEQALTHLYLPNALPDRKGRGAETPLLVRAREALLSYLAGERQGLDLPLAPVGTDFQRSVWTALKAIPYGQTRTYGEIAAAIGRPKAVRAVGQANHHNPLPIFLPCHRVVGSGGTLTGYAGGLEMKKALLTLESGKERFSW
ncbi:methylated-DNA--[protein]-cysteine S-methyltransferase [Intestinimonas butyriciproducens]|uniref:methylated-DNA--[protein]-cysteine S-methyltransferase n=1 Tax=Intestinimonas butyriciproducens TaxID=1297617 RepID=UPI001959D93D|nr:methylated-DNA--[protein]-cysteine S-methyltransferase [Intestinimonas butyriciproducens]MBM6976524.1 methylated-DNA--[protein]-cysteine S-methyltransferase [Intestinimonas butyriciproducens]